MQRVSEIMTRNVRAISPQESLQHAAQLMGELNVGSLPVCENERLVGIVTDRDITVRATAAGRSPQEAHVKDVMSTDVRTCFEDQSVDDVLREMGGDQIRRVPVVSHDEQHKLVGIVSLGDLATKTGDNQQQRVEQATEKISQPSHPDRSGQQMQGRQMQGQQDRQGRNAAAGDSSDIDMDPGPDLNPAAEAGAVGGTHFGTASAGGGIGNLGRVGDVTDADATRPNAVAGSPELGGSAISAGNTSYTGSAVGTGNAAGRGGQAATGTGHMGAAGGAGGIGENAQKGRVRMAGGGDNGQLGNQPLSPGVDAALRGETASTPGSSIPRPGQQIPQPGVAATGGGGDTAGTGTAARPGTSTGTAAGAGVTGGTGSPGGINAARQTDNASVSAAGSGGSTSMMDIETPAGAAGVANGPDATRDTKNAGGGIGAGVGGASGGVSGTENAQQHAAGKKRAPRGT